MRRYFERIFEKLTPNVRVLVAVCASTPFLSMILVGHGLALGDPEIRQGLHVGPMIALQALLAVCIGVNLFLGASLWPKRWSDEPADGKTMLACLSIGVAYSGISVQSGTFTTGVSIIIAGVLAIGLLLFEWRPMMVAYIVCALLTSGHEVLVHLGWLSYAPALNSGAFIDGQPTWWFMLWRQFMLYVGWAVVTALLLLLLARLDHLNAKLTSMSYTDGLTGLANRRRFMEVLDAELTRQDRSGNDLSLLLIDVDRFKEVNDQHGHHVGDAVLCTLASILLASVRVPLDLPCRLGGEEFAVILPNARHDEAMRVAERLREQVASHAFSDRDVNLRVTISIGLVSARDMRRSELLKRADEALYEAKQAGRNRVVAVQEGRA